MDKQITCVECGTVFPFTEAEQNKFATLGFTNEPKRCKPCRDARKARNTEANGGARSAGGPPKEMHDVVCASCGQRTQVPFKPRGTRPVYCRGCFRPAGRR